jgi:G3E family GTPase
MRRLRDMVLKWLPVAQNSALEGQAAEVGDSPIKSVLRSKGFMWMSYSHASAFYWSHAGQHFDIRDEGDWWATHTAPLLPDLEPLHRGLLVGVYAGNKNRVFMPFNFQGLLCRVKILSITFQPPLIIAVSKNKCKRVTCIQQQFLRTKIYTRRWACVPDDEWPSDPTQRKVITSDFDLETPYGDRRQEIVFIGANMDERAICDQLDTALLNDEELVKYHERYAGVGFISFIFLVGENS